MICVTIDDDRITISGHAGYAEYGKDIVCAGVTALVQTYINGLKNLTDEKVEMKTTRGFCEIETKNITSNKGSLLTSFFLIGIDNIREEFSEYVNIKINHYGQAWNPFKKATGEQA